MYGLLNLRLIGIVAASVAIFLSGWWINGWRWEAKYEALQKEYAEAVVKAQQEVRRKEMELQIQVDQIRREQANEERRIINRYQSAIDGLRNRPTGRSTAPAAPSTGEGSTGAQLARGDSEFLTGYAADAEKLRLAYEECRAQYEAARAKLQQ